ncbi:MAG: hypothetical protein V7607_3936 [Solirubrobacteraceae bacterium]
MQQFTTTGFEFGDASALLVGGMVERFSELLEVLTDCYSGCLEILGANTVLDEGPRMRRLNGNQVPLGDEGFSYIHSPTYNVSMQGRRWPHLVDASDIQQWAQDRIQARSEFPRLVRRLIGQTNDQVVRLEMRAGKEVDVKGYDGIVEAARGTPFVPEGMSVWELGTGADPAAKASNDYRDRTKDSLGVEKGDAVFVAVAARRWDGKDDWARRRGAEGVWRDVRALDVSDIEQALESAPAVHFAFSEMVGKPVSGVRTIEDWWQRFSTITRPVLTPELVLAGRADQAANLLRLVAQEGRITTIAAPGTDDVIAFVAGALMTMQGSGRDDLLARTLIVHDALSLRMLEHSPSLLILVPFEEELRRAAELVRTHHIIMLAPEGTPSDIQLPSIDREAFASTLRESGVEDATARWLAAAAHRSIVAFQRDSASGGAVQRRWSLQSPIARRAWLVSSWNERRSGDTEALSALFGTSYEAALEELRTLSVGEDPLFTVVGGTWALVSPGEAWPFGVSALNDFDLSSLETTIQTVLGAVDPGLELPAEERWTAGLYGKTPIHSSDLRTGLATTLALCGARGHDTSLGSAGRVSDWAGRVIYQLLDRANEDKSGQLWASLTDVLPLLAEAAPDVFLRAVQTGVSGDEPLLRLMFSDSTQDTFSVSSPHTGLLWALERVAWASEHAGLASKLLARLAEIDPGGRLGNRPLGSLVDIFRPWIPQTSLLLDRRLAVLRGLRRDHADVAWSLLLQLLPETSAIGSYTNAPRFRDWKPETEGVSGQEFWDASSAVAETLIEMAGEEPSRWPELLKRLDDFPPPERDKAMDTLSALADSAGSPDAELRKVIWASLAELVRRHRAFATAEWALPASVVDRLAEITDRLKPRDPVEVHRWLFETHLPEMREEVGTYEERQAEVDAARVEAVTDILALGGADAVEQLAGSVAQPGFVGVATAACGDDKLDQRVVNLLDSDDRRLASFAHGYCFKRAQAAGWPWLNDQLERLADRPQAQARLLQVTDDLTEAWRRAKELGPETEAAYWQEFVVIGRGKDFALVNEATKALLEHGRVVAAIDLMSLYTREDGSPVSPDLMLEGLEALVKSPPEHEELARLSSYELDLLLGRLRGSDDVDEQRLALLEWRLLPALGFQARSPTLERHLSLDPAFFVEVLSLLFRPSSVEAADTESVPEHVASNAWHLLHEWRIVPGSSEQMGAIDEDALMAWITEARALLEKADRVAVGDVYIGHVLAHARGDSEDDSWPTRPVRNVIEQLANTEIEDGFRTQTYNNRGVTTRAPLDGGGPERGLAVRYHELAGRVRDEWPRTAAILTSLADGYEAEAARHDEEAERLRQDLE